MASGCGVVRLSEEASSALRAFRTLQREHNGKFTEAVLSNMVSEVHDVLGYERSDRFFDLVKKEIEGMFEESRMRGWRGPDLKEKRDNESQCWDDVDAFQQIDFDKFDHLQGKKKTVIGSSRSTMRENSAKLVTLKPNQVHICEGERRSGRLSLRKNDHPLYLELQSGSSNDSFSEDEKMGGKQRLVSNMTNEEQEVQVINDLRPTATLINVKPFIKRKAPEVILLNSDSDNEESVRHSMTDSSVPCDIKTVMNNEGEEKEKGERGLIDKQWRQEDVNEHLTSNRAKESTLDHRSSKSQKNPTTRRKVTHSRVAQHKLSMVSNKKSTLRQKRDGVGKAKKQLSSLFGETSEDSKDASDSDSDSSEWSELNSDDDMTDQSEEERRAALHDADAVMVCQYDRIQRMELGGRQVWKFLLENGILMHDGKETFFNLATGKALFR